jgi:hypothetical protein
MEIDKYCQWLDETTTGRDEDCWKIDFKRLSDGQAETIGNRCRQVWGWLNGQGSPTPPHYLEDIWNAIQDSVSDNLKTCHLCDKPVTPDSNGITTVDGDRPVHPNCYFSNLTANPTINSKTCHLCHEPITPNTPDSDQGEMFIDGDLHPVHRVCFEKVTPNPTVNTNGTQARAALTGQPVEDLP